MTAPAVRDGRRFSAGLAALLAAGLAVAYGGGFGIGFYFDDSYGIQENPAIRSLANIPSFFTDPFTLTALRTNIDVRPVLTTSFALNYAISGLDPWSYHAANLLLHFLTAWMVFLLVRDHLWWPASERGAGNRAQVPAAAAALFFAFAPVNSQALNYMWARSALLCTTFYLAGFFALVRGRLVPAVVLHVLALLTKTIAVTLPAVFVVYDYLYRDRGRFPDFASWLSGWRRLAVPVAALLVLDVVYVVVRAWMLPPWIGDYLHEGWVTSRIWFVSQWSALLHYVRIFVWPAGLSVDHDFAYNMTGFEPRALLSLAVLLVWVAAALRAARTQPLFTFATLWFFLTLAPESSVLPLAEVVNDHRPYIASTLGLSVLLVLGVERVASLVGGVRRREVFLAATALLCAAGVAITSHRTWEWSDQMRLWEATVEASPRNGRAWMNAGLAYMRAGRYPEARVRFEKARSLNPSYSYVYMNLSVLESAEGNAAAATAWAREAVRHGPHLSRAHFYLGSALEKQGDLAEAAAEYRRALEIEPNDAAVKAAVERVGKPHTPTDVERMTTALRLLDVERKPDAAIAELRALLAQNPTHYGAHWQMARALDAAGRRAEARLAWQKMLELAVRWNNAGDEQKVRARLAEAE